MRFDINNLDIKKLNFRKGKNAIHLSLSGDKYQLLEDGKTINNNYFWMYMIKQLTFLKIYFRLLIL